MTKLMKKRLDELIGKGSELRFGCFDNDVAAMEITGTEECVIGDDSQEHDFDVTVETAGPGVLDRVSLEKMLALAGYQLVGHTIDDGFSDYYYSR